MIGFCNFCNCDQVRDRRTQASRRGHFILSIPNQFQRAGLEKGFSTLLPGDDKNPVPMVAASPVRFECVYHTTLRLPGNPPVGTVDMVIGRVVGVHIDDAVLTDGKVDVKKTMPIARCGYYDYAVVTETFQMIIPGDEATLAGLEGSSKRMKELNGVRAVANASPGHNEDAGPGRKPEAQ